MSIASPEFLWGQLEQKYYEKGGEPGTFDRSQVKSQDIFSPIVDGITNTLSSVGGGLAAVKKYAPIAAAAAVGLFILSRRK